MNIFDNLKQVPLLYAKGKTDNNIEGVTIGRPGISTAVHKIVGIQRIKHKRGTHLFNILFYLKNKQNEKVFPNLFSIPVSAPYKSDELYCKRQIFKNFTNIEINLTNKNQYFIDFAGVETADGRIKIYDPSLNLNNINLNQLSEFKIYCNEVRSKMTLKKYLKHHNLDENNLSDYKNDPLERKYASIDHIISVHEAFYDLHWTSDEVNDWNNLRLMDKRENSSKGNRKL